MDEEERKRIAAEAKKRAAAALGGAVRTAPSGVVTDTRELAKARAKEALKGKLKETAVEEPPGMIQDGINAIGRFFTGVAGEVPQEGDLDEKLTDPMQGAPMRTDPMSLLAQGMKAVVNPILGGMDTLENRDERTGSTAPLTTALTAGLDTLSVGSLNKLRGTVDAMVEVGNGDITPEGFRARHMEAIDERALEQEEIRAANPGTALAADVVASVISGAALAKGAFATTAKYAPKLATNIGRNWYSRIALGAGAAGTEAFAYRMNKDGDLERAASDASLAVLGGAVLGGIFESGKGILSIIRNVKAPDVVEEGVGKEIIRMINIERQTQGLPPAKASDISAEVAKLGPGATLMDAYPTLKQFAAHVLRNEDSAMAGDGLRSVIASRADLLEELLAKDGTLRTAFDAKALRSYAAFSSDVSARFAKLQPRFAEVYDNYKDLRFTGKQITDNIGKLFGDKTRRSAAQTDLISAIQAQIKSYTAQGKKIKVKSPSGGTTTKFADELTLEQAVDLKRVMQTAAGKKEWVVSGSAKTLPLDNIALRDLSRIQNYLADLIHSKADELIPLDKVYGNIAGLKSAYKAGTEAFTKTAADSADVTAFLMDANKSAASKRAFIEGAKYRIFKLLNKAKTADNIDAVIKDNREIFQRMEAMFGAEGLKEMIEDVRPNVVKLKTVEDLRKSIPKVERPEPKSTTIGESLDVATAIGGVPGIVSKAGAIGALRRLMGQATDPAEATKRREMYGGILSKMGEGASDAYKTLEDMLARPIRPSDMGSITRPAGAGMSAAQAVNSEEARDGELPQ